MTLLERLVELEGCAVVHADAQRGLVVFWAGSRLFLEFALVGGELVEGDAWSASPAPRDVKAARGAAKAYYATAGAWRA